MPGADLVVLDLPTGIVIVDRGHNTVHGDPAELRRLARAILAVCDQAESDPPDWRPAGFQHTLEGV
ncbi:hypothetical protein LGR54_04420 [Ancylobacter sp. Lp-2]|uniref:hypothetical protein n=1 Tax=Ancylobacter sp. Lp-2 TaxID=2881339 RepID=UPI001E593767|nr:hypothetical protein [Ancylobacter sp. Lp-2]MCB4767839.1 hypothetical protein [Ancylobacter sp. Lp-2]